MTLGLNSETDNESSFGIEGFTLLPESTPSIERVISHQPVADLDGLIVAVEDDKVATAVVIDVGYRCVWRGAGLSHPQKLSTSPRTRLDPERGKVEVTSSDGMETVICRPFDIIVLIVTISAGFMVSPTMS